MLRTLAVAALITTLIACGGTSDGDDKDTEPTGGDETQSEDDGTESEVETTDSESTDDGTTDTEPNESEVEEDLCETAWADAAPADRVQWMEDCLMPEMSAAFTKAYPEEYGDFDCTSCHGDDYNGGTYSMPAVDSYRDDDPSTWPEDVQNFMGEEVKPLLGEILGVGEYDPKTGTGVGCSTCHLN